LAILASPTIAMGARADGEDFPVYSDQRIARPPGLRKIQPQEFKVDLERLRQYPDGILYGNQQLLQKLGVFLLNDPDGRRLWEKEASKAADTLNRWDFDRQGFGADRYIYNIPQLQNLSLVFVYTGHQELGRFIREHMLQVAQLPFAFWMHAELRGYDPARPLGKLETSSLCSTVAMTLTCTYSLFLPSERVAIEGALRTKGVQPCLNWLDKPAPNNWTVYIAPGAYIASKYLDDTRGMEKAFQAMAWYASQVVEADGSYGEGMGYFNGPASALVPAVLTMKAEDRARLFANTGLRHTARWEIYPFLSTPGSGKGTQPEILAFGDNGYEGPVGGIVVRMLALAFKDPVASWLWERSGFSSSFQERLLSFSLGDDAPRGESPEEAGLPLVRVFSSGDCFIRSTWRENGIVMAMRSGDGARTQFGHQRPELGSICLGAYGEYLIVSPASASYRSTLHYQWDKATKSANTITIDDKNQLFPDRPVHRWNRSDVSKLYVRGTPKAEVVLCQSGSLADVIVNELAGAYHAPMANVRRCVLFVKEPGFFVIVDKLEAKDAEHKYTWRLHLNNRDGKGGLAKIGDGHWSFTRPLASLDINLYCTAAMQAKEGLGYMHGSSRDYSPDGTNEGKLGSSLELEAFNRTACRSMDYIAVLCPTRPGTGAPSVSRDGGKVRVGDWSVTLDGGECTVEKGGRSEVFRFW